MSSVLPSRVSVEGSREKVLAARKWAKWEFVALLIPLSTFLALATYRIHGPGLYYDEMFVISPAYGVPAYTTWFGVPIQISPYVGAYKAWIYPPIFALFGVSAWTVRLPAILVSCGSLVVGYALMRRVLTPRWALVFTAACAVHPGFIFLTRVDWGPQVFMLFLKALCLLLCFLWLDGTKKTCWPVLALWVLGFWDKFNFVWFVVALVIATWMVYGDVILRKVRNIHPRLLVGLGAGLAAGGLLALWVVFPLLEKPQAADFSDRLLKIWSLYGSTGTGLATACMWLKRIPALPSWTGWIALALTILFLISYLTGCSVRKSQAHRIDGRTLRFCLWCLLMFGVVFLEIALTPQAGGAHHTIMLFPFDLLACFSSAYLCANLISGRRRVFVLVLQGCVLCLWVAANLESLGTQFAQFRNAANFYGRFSPRIESLAKFLDKKGADAGAIFCIEWGLGNQLRALCKPAIAQKVKDEWPTFQNWSANRANARAIAAWIFPRQGKTLYLSFTKQDPVFAPAQRHFEEISVFAGRTFHPVRDLPPDLVTTYQVFENDAR